MEELDLKELFKVIWDEKVQEILIIAIFLVLGVMYTFGLKVPKYSASTTLVLAQSDKNKVTENTITTADITINSKLVLQNKRIDIVEPNKIELTFKEKIEMSSGIDFDKIVKKFFRK